MHGHIGAHRPLLERRGVGGGHEDGALRQERLHRRLRERRPLRRLGARAWPGSGLVGLGQGLGSG